MRIDTNGDLEVWAGASGNGRKTSFDYFYIVEKRRSELVRTMRAGQSLASCGARGRHAIQRISSSSRSLRERDHTFESVILIRDETGVTTTASAGGWPFAPDSPGALRVGKSATSQPHYACLRSEVGFINTFLIIEKLSSPLVSERHESCTVRRGTIVVDTCTLSTHARQRLTSVPGG